MVQSKSNGIAGWTHGLGAISLLSYVVGGAFSFFLGASFLPGKPRNANIVHFFDGLAQRLSFLPAWVGEELRGHGVFRSPEAFIAGYCLPLTVATICAVVLIILVLARQRTLTERDAKRIFGWAVAFTIIGIFTYNVLTQDIWLSVVWGRMIAHGINPYSHRFTRAMSASLPLLHDPFAMTYGPLWALISGGVMALFGDGAITEWFVLKLIMAGAWLGCLWVVGDLAREQGPGRRSAALAILGWLPVGVHCGVAEGHNDMAMIFLSLLWLRSMRSSSSKAPLFLAGSVLIKYVTAPLAAFDLLYHWRSRIMSISRYVKRVLPAAVIVGAAGVFLVGSAAGIRETASMHDWRYLAPSDMLRLLEPLLGRPLPRQNWIFAAIFAGILLVELIRVFRSPTGDNVIRGQLAMMAAILLIGVGHVWPWFYVWCLPLAVLAPGYWLSWFMIGAAVISPFSVVPRLCIARDPYWGNAIPSIAMYGAGACAAVLYLIYRPRRALTT